MIETKMPVPPCLMKTWQAEESNLYYWLFKQCGDGELCFDLLQDTFLRAMQQQQKFCDIANQRAWLYRVAQNLLVDEQRYFGRWHSEIELPEPVWQPNQQPAVDSLVQCLPKALKRLCDEDRQIIEACDLKGQSQVEFSRQHALTLSATKSRIQRARQRLRGVLKSQCHIRFDDQQHVCCFYADSSPDHT